MARCEVAGLDSFEMIAAASARNTTTASHSPAGEVPWASAQTRTAPSSARAPRGEGRRRRAGGGVAAPYEQPHDHRAGEHEDLDHALLHQECCHRARAGGRPPRQRPPGTGGDQGLEDAQHPAQHPGHGQQFAVDLARAEHRRGDEDGGARRDQQWSRAALRSRDPADAAGEQDRDDDGHQTEEPERDPPAAGIGELEQADEQRRSVDPVVAVQRRARRPL